MRGRPLPDILKVHAHLSADGWAIVDRGRDAPAPPRAVAMYRRGQITAWLIQDNGRYTLRRTLVYGPTDPHGGDAA